MAEFVELSAEEWATELEHLEKIQLFTSNEIKAIACKRRACEYKLRKKSKTKEDYLKYIQLEVDLMRLIKFRRNQMNIHSHHAVVEGLQISRIISLFKRVIFRYQGDIKLWMSFFKYCSETNMLKPASQMLVRMLKVHGDKENLWSFAAKWDYESLNSPDTARQFLLKGIRHHPTSKLLYTELFKLELNFATAKREQMEQDASKMEEADLKNIDDVMSLKLAQVVYENSVKKIKDVNFKVGLLNLACEYPNTESLQDKISEDLRNGHEEDEVTWDILARRNCKGMMYKDLDASTTESTMEVDEEETQKSNEEAETPADKAKAPADKVKIRATKAEIQAAVDVYKLAIKKMNTMKMWSFYLGFLFEIREDKSSLVVFKRKILRKALREALAAGRIEEKYFLLWIENLNDICLTQKRRVKVLKKATEQYPQSVNLWHSRLRYHLLRDKEVSGRKIFDQAIEKITGDQSLPIWKLMIQYLQTKSNAQVEELFKAGIRLGGEIALSLKPMYLHWLALTKGVGIAKSSFESPEMLNPPCLAAMNEMISLELMQPDVNKKFIRRCHEMACSFAGENNLDVWISYIEFELQFGDGEGPFVIYMRAVKTLCAELVQEFISRCQELLENEKQGMHS